MDKYDRALLDFIDANHSPFHVAAAQAELLDRAGYTRLEESGKWGISEGGRYYVMRNGTALIAFRIPSGAKGFRIAASHCDCPRPKLKENPEMSADGKYTRLNAEIYGGAILSTWFDRPLSIAGRVCIAEGEEIRCINIDIDRDLLVIPSLAIHMNRDVNNGYKYNPQSDMLPLYALKDAPSVKELVAESAGVRPEEILGFDLFVYNRQKGSAWGAENEFISAPGIDDAQCAFSSLTAFLEAGDGGNIPVHVLYDNEEVGSGTMQGAASTFLKDTLTRIGEAMGLGAGDFARMIAGSFMLSADNAHAVHPNSPEKADPVNRPVPGGGVVLKFSANQKYTTDGYSAAVVRNLAAKAGVTLQVFTNRSDMPGGSTLGNISSTQLPVHTADIGVAQLAMHSCYETCAAGDTAQMVALMRANYEA